MISQSDAGLSVVAAGRGFLACFVIVFLLIDAFRATEGKTHSLCTFDNLFFFCCVYGFTRTCRMWAQRMCSKYKENNQSIACLSQKQFLFVRSKLNVRQYYLDSMIS